MPDTALCVVCDQDPFKHYVATESHIAGVKWCHIANRPELTPIGLYIGASKPTDKVTQYSPEYKFMLQLIYVIGKEGVPPSRIKQVTQSRPMTTIQDVDMVTTDLWTMAVNEFGISREWLIKQLPESKL